MTSRSAITFDFHNTLVACDAWFDLEIRSLPSAVVARLVGEEVDGVDFPSAAELTTTYQALRSEIIGHGIEMDALAGVVETLRRHGLTGDAASFAREIDALMRDCLDEATAMPGAIETVTELRGLGHRLGVVSSAVYHPFLAWALERFGILDCFDAVVTSASAGFYKSRPEIYHHALAALGAEARESCHVGDSVRWDHLMAKSLGMRTTLVSTDANGLTEGLPKPDLHLRSLVGAGPLIDGLARQPATVLASA